MNEAELLYTTLEEFHLGRGNATTRREMAAALGITERDLRRLTAQINASTEFDRLVSVTGDLYLCETEEECLAALKHAYAPAITLIKKAKQMSKKFNRNGQGRISIGSESYMDFIDTFTV